MFFGLPVGQECPSYVGALGLWTKMERGAGHPNIGIQGGERVWSRDGEEGPNSIGRFVVFRSTP